jgi:DNA-binding phage protein
MDKEMMTLDQVREALKDRKIAMVSEATGLSRQYLYNLMLGKTPNPSYDAVFRVVEYLERK